MTALLDLVAEKEQDQCFQRMNQSPKHLEERSLGQRRLSRW